MTLTQIVVYVAAFLLGTVATARFVRLWTQDNFPPVQWVRTRVIAKIGPDNPWSDIAECPWCSAFWFVLVNALYAFFSDLHWSWWWLNAIMAATYVAAWLVVHDED